VREVSRQAALAREERLAAILGATSGNSRRMETSLLRFEGLLQGLATAAEARLADPSFTGKAPAAVVAGAERRVAELRDEIARLERGS
jgi:hypothetical protein